jgi:hypothetical protein
MQSIKNLKETDLCVLTSDINYVVRGRFVTLQNRPLFDQQSIVVALPLPCLVRGAFF